MKTKLFHIERAHVIRPLIAHIPHSSARLGKDIRHRVILTKKDLKEELRVMTDWYTDEIFGCVVNVGGTAFINNQSRLVYDPERFEDKRREKMEKVGMGLIYTRTHDGGMLRKEVSVRERHGVIRNYYRPYHQGVADAVANIKQRFGYCLIVDGHSFSSRPLPYEPSQSPRRPDICIGTDSFHTPSRLVRLAETYFRKYGLRVGLNKPYGGTFVPIPFYRKDTSVQSVMIEINRSLYMDEFRTKKTLKFRGIVQMLKGLFECISSTQAVESRYENVESI